MICLMSSTMFSLILCKNIYLKHMCYVIFTRRHMYNIAHENITTILHILIISLPYPCTIWIWRMLKTLRLLYHLARSFQRSRHGNGIRFGNRNPVHLGFWARWTRCSCSSWPWVICLCISGVDRCVTLTLRMFAMSLYRIICWFSPKLIVWQDNHVRISSCFLMNLCYYSTPLEISRLLFFKS